MPTNHWSELLLFHTIKNHNLSIQPKGIVCICLSLGCLYPRKNENVSMGRYWWNQRETREQEIMTLSPRLFSLRKGPFSSSRRLPRSEWFSCSSENAQRCATGCRLWKAILSTRMKASSLPFMLTKTRRGWVSFSRVLVSGIWL